MRSASPVAFYVCINSQASVTVDAMMRIASHHVDFVDAVDYRGGVTTGDFVLRIGEKAITMEK